MINKVSSWNVRGINEMKKRNVIKGCLGRWKAEVVCLQETKLDFCDNLTVKSLWKLRNVGFHSIPSFRVAGGILVMWNDDTL